MKETKPALFSPIQLATSRNESIGSTTVDKAIARNHEMLWDSFFHPLLGLEKYKKLLEDIRAVTSDVVLQAELETRWRDEDSQQSEEINTLLQEVRFACLHLELARAAETHNDCDRAWAFTCYASLIVGEITEKSAAIINAMDTKKRSIQNSKNGKTRTKNFLPAKEEVVRLLEQLKPERGWPSLRGAAIALEEDMIEFILKTRPSGLTASNIRSLLEKDWLPDDEFVNDAWIKTKAL